MGIWEQLNTKTLEDGSDAAVINAQTKDIQLQESNKPELMDTIVVNQASMRSDGGIIPGTMSFKVLPFTDNGTQTVLEPARGEVWRIFQPLARVTAGTVSTTVDYELWLEDDTGAATATSYRMFYMGSTSSKPILLEDANYFLSELTIGYGQKLNFEIGSFSGTNIVAGVLAGRIR
jgi:hypothetical protein